MKLARQYFLELAPAQPLRTRFIARRQSYHGATLGPLALGGHAARRAPYEPLLLPGSCSHVSPCYAYRGRVGGGEEEDGQVRETDEEYVARLARELDDEFRRVGPETVCAFVAEPIVGAVSPPLLRDLELTRKALGCVPSLPGYFAAVRAVCERHGALLVFDEVMCGMGRSGTPHAWQSLLPAPVAPDIQTVGKVLGGGYVPIAAVLVGARVVDALGRGSGVFAHGQTYQGHPVACAVALEVQRVIREEGLLANVVKLARLLEEGLRERLEGHMHVGNIRGRGLFWGVSRRLGLWVANVA
jgi:adenosylmethionine-8-amino-7-oxononanoate aminotransferase